MNDEKCGVCVAIGSTSSRKEPEASDVTTPEKIVGIYGLRCRTTNKWYVGQSSDIIKRWTHYENLWCKGQRKLYNALIKYGAHDFEFFVFEKCENVDWILDYREMYWIRRLDSMNRGYNLTDGGRGCSCSIEVKKKMSDNRYGKRLSTLHKLHISKGLMGRVVNLSTREKISKSNTGKIRTEKMRSHMRNVKIGTIISSVTREKLRKTSTGRRHSLEARAKISAARAGIKFSEEHRQKLREARARYVIKLRQSQRI